MGQALDLTAGTILFSLPQLSPPRSLSSLLTLNGTFPACLLPLMPTLLYSLPCSRSLSLSFWRTLPHFPVLCGWDEKPSSEGLLCGLWTGIPEGGAVPRACQPEDYG